MMSCGCRSRSLATAVRIVSARAPSRYTRYPRSSARPSSSNMRSMPATRAESGSPSNREAQTTACPSAVTSSQRSISPRSSASWRMATILAALIAMCCAPSRLRMNRSQRRAASLMSTRSIAHPRTSARSASTVTRRPQRGAPRARWRWAAHAQAVLESIREVYGVADPITAKVEAAGRMDYEIARNICLLSDVTAERFDRGPDDFRIACGALTPSCPDDLSEFVAPESPLASRGAHA
jgi:hypothetical protein